ncbi:MAG: hypothetical protein OHK0039_27670 [Bacteroidia bacterium]
MALALMPVLSLPAQLLIADPDTLDFGVVTETQPVQRWLHFSNPHPYDVAVAALRLYPIYGTDAFTADRDTLFCAAGGTCSVMLTMQVRHNIRHASALLLVAPHLGSQSIHLRGQGRYTQTYYSSTENLEEQALKDALKTRLGQGFIALSYNQARDEMFMSIDNQRLNGQQAPVNTLEGVYTGFTVTGYTSRSDAQNQGMNTEHTYPQSFFNEQLPMRADLFHLFPTEIQANATRANLPFGTVSNPTWQQGGSKMGNGVFEPRDTHKGPVARAMFYFVLRYQNYQQFLNGQEAVLRQWHSQYPPTAVEQRRNADIAQVQGNRNPLIDYPQFIERMTSISSATSTAPDRYALDRSHDSIDFGTVATGAAAHFYLTFVNYGNRSVTIDNLSLSDSRLRLADSAGFTILPGTTRQLDLLLEAPTADTLTATLRYTSSLPGSGTQVLPVLAVIEGANAIPAPWLPDLRVSYDATAQRLDLTTTQPLPDSLPLELLTTSGQRVWHTTLRAGQRSLPLTSLPAGIYLLRLGDDRQQLTRKVYIGF